MKVDVRSCAQALTETKIHGAFREYADVTIGYIDLCWAYTLLRRGFKPKSVCKFFKGVKPLFTESVGFYIGGKYIERVRHGKKSSEFIPTGGDEYLKSAMRQRFLPVLQEIDFDDTELQRLTVSAEWDGHFHGQLQARKHAVRASWLLSYGYSAVIAYHMAAIVELVSTFGFRKKAATEFYSEMVEYMNFYFEKFLEGCDRCDGMISAAQDAMNREIEKHGLRVVDTGEQIIVEEIPLNNSNDKFKTILQEMLTVDAAEPAPCTAHRMINLTEAKK